MVIVCQKTLQDHNPCLGQESGVKGLGMKPTYLPDFISHLSSSSFQRVGHDPLSFVHEAVKVVLVLEAFSVNLVDIFGAGRTSGEPAILGDNLKSSDRGAIAGSAG